jgi:hypothetical protein
MPAPTVEGSGMCNRFELGLMCFFLTPTWPPPDQGEGRYSTTRSQKRKADNEVCRRGRLHNEVRC